MVTGELKQARNCIIHFVNRMWAWSDHFLDTVDSSNSLIGLWWHGRLDSEESEYQVLLDRARRAHPRFVRLHVTCSIARETMLTLGVPEEKLVLLPMGLNLNRFRPPRSSGERERMRKVLGVPSGAIAIGCFQKDGEGWGDGMSPKMVKGPDVLAATLVRLAQKHPVYAVVPGPARGYLRERLTEAGVPYHGPGYVSNDDLPGYYHALDIYMSPTRDEGGPAGVLEAMGSGVPVVSTRAGMPVDMIDHGENGFLVDVEDVDGLVSCTKELIERLESRRRISESALFTIQPYDWPVVARRYAERALPTCPGG